MTTRILAILATLALFTASGCSSKKDSGNESKKNTTTQAPPAPVDPVIAKARGLFNMQCATCHGADGKGNGPASVNLNPKPRNYTSKKWQRSVTDQHIADVIRKGGAAMGLSAMMAPHPDLSDEDIAGLVKLIRSFGPE